MRAWVPPSVSKKSIKKKYTCVPQYKVPLFSFFLWQSNIPFSVCVCVCVCVYNIFIIHSSVDGRFGGFHVLTLVNSAAVSAGVRVAFWMIVFSGYTLWSGILRLYDDSVFSFLRNLHAVLHNGCTNLHSHQGVGGLLFSLQNDLTTLKPYSMTMLSIDLS